MEIVAAIVLIILCATALGFFFGPDGDRWWGAWFGFALAFNVTVLGVVGYVAYHFITKYW